jgi:hypothetical protein
MERTIEMKRLWLLLIVGLALVVGIVPAQAASISNLSGQSCGDLTGTWHFVNNQTGGAAAGTLTATWSSGDTCTKTADTVLANTQHFFCTASGTLLTAVTNLGGRLVLSDFTCETKEPPCEGKGCEPPPPPK